MVRHRFLPTLALVVALAAPATAKTWPHERNGFTIGFNIGGGTATIKPDQAPDESHGGGAASIRLGWALSNQFLIGLESTGWGGKIDSDVDLYLYSHKLNFTWYPSATGWFVRAGFGRGNSDIPGQIAGLDVRVTDSGPGPCFGFGGGHEWRLTRKFALGAAFDYCSIDLKGGQYNYANFTAQLNWYF